MTLCDTILPTSFALSQQFSEMFSQEFVHFVSKCHSDKTSYYIFIIFFFRAQKEVSYLYARIHVDLNIASSHKIITC